jgi:hypothetical protein
VRIGLELDALGGEDVVERVEREAGDVAAEEGVALEQLVLDALGVAARGERLPMAVLLVADGAGGGARRAAGVLRVALRGGARRA